MHNNKSGEEKKKEQNSSNLILPSEKQFKVAAQKYQISLNDVLFEVFETGAFELGLKDGGTTKKNQKEAQAMFTEVVMAGFLKKTKNIHIKAHKSCILEITQEDNRKKQEERRKDWLARVVIHYLKRNMIKAKGLDESHAEKEATISYPVIIGLVVIIHVATNKIDKDKLEKLCNNHSYFVGEDRCFRWGRREGEDSGIFGDPEVEQLVGEIIPKIIKNVLNLGDTKIMEIITMSDIWVHNEEVGSRSFVEEEVDELISIMENYKDQNQPI